jgi:3,4-dihydroxy 2-butanone 4-phosphate synthase / GTP cyclohydrolase II
MNQLSAARNNATPFPLVKFVAKSKLPTDFGDFDLYVYQDREGKEQLAIVRGDVAGKTNVLARLHSECLTGDIFKSQRCDCGDQLQNALKKVDAEGTGVVLYLRQEGRGIGLTNKIKAYALQEQGYNTVQANVMLGLPVDARDYSIALAILKDLEIQSIRLLTNNPKKMEAFGGSGVTVTERVPLQINPNEHNVAYLRTKRDETGHFLTHLQSVVPE